MEMSSYKRNTAELLNSNNYIYTSSSSFFSHHLILTWSIQLKPHAIAIVHQNGLSSASCRASVAVTFVSTRQIWWIHVVGGWPQARLHSCDGRSPSLALVQIRRIWLAGTVCESPATWPNRRSLRSFSDLLQSRCHNYVSCMPGRSMFSLTLHITVVTSNLGREINIWWVWSSDVHSCC